MYVATDFKGRQPHIILDRESQLKKGEGENQSQGGMKTPPPSPLHSTSLLLSIIGYTAKA